MEGPTFLGKVTGADPEHFALITMDMEKGTVAKTTFFTEKEFREFTRVNGRPRLTEHDIDLMIENARKHLV